MCVCVYLFWKSQFSSVFEERYLQIWLAAQLTCLSLVWNWTYFLRLYTEITESPKTGQHFRPPLPFPAACECHTIFPFSKTVQTDTVGGEPGCDFRDSRNTRKEKRVLSLWSTSMNAHVDKDTWTQMTSAPLMIACAQSALLWWWDRNECLSQKKKTSETTQREVLFFTSTLHAPNKDCFKDLLKEDLSLRL